MKHPTNNRTEVALVNRSWVEENVYYSHSLAYLYDTDVSHSFVDAGIECTKYYSILLKQSTMDSTMDERHSSS